MLAKKYVAVLGAAVLAVGALAKPAHAELLSDLIANYGSPNGSLSIGDKTFSNFTVKITGPSSSSFSASDVDITATTSVTGLYGLDMGLFVPTAPPPIGLDIVISYLTTASGGNLITGAEIDANPRAFSPSSSVTITDTFSAPNNSVTIGAYALNFTGTETNVLTATAPFVTGVSSVVTTKDISLNSSSTGLFGLSDIQQYYIQNGGNTGSGVPEPASLGILGVGAMGLLLRRRNRA